MLKQGSPDASRPLSGVRVLLAEDEFFIALELRDQVESEGGLVPYETVRSCKEASALFGKAEVDIAILDVMLDDGEVFDAADTLHRRGVPIVFHSGHAQPSSTKERFPGSAWLEKPSDQAELSRVLQRALK